MGRPAQGTRTPTMVSRQNFPLLLGRLHVRRRGTWPIGSFAAADDIASAIDSAAANDPTRIPPK